MTKPKIRRHFVTVRGSGIFPTDMLRYDGVGFASDSDRATAGVDSVSFETPADARRSIGQPTRTITLTTDDNARWTPTVARWASFGWRVVEHVHHG
jgi:hypothetical protein